MPSLIYTKNSYHNKTSNYRGHIPMKFHKPCLKSAILLSWILDSSYNFKDMYKMYDAINIKIMVLTPLG